MKKVLAFVLLAISICFVRVISAQTTAFTYQGSLKDGSIPANGNYDLEFKLFDVVSAGAQQGSTLQRLNVAVANGIFSVSLDFGAGTLPGADRFLDIAVRTAGGGAFTALSPRQKVNSAPYSVKSLNSASSDVATNATQLGGVAANQYVVTTDPRMTDPRTPTAGSADYVQNRTTQQALSNFNVSGNGTVGGTLRGNIVNATTQYNIGNQRVLSGSSGSGLLFVGQGSGGANTGGFNSFVGINAGAFNTEGFGNSFVGSNAGVTNTTGNQNSFFGSFAGSDNDTGFSNSFFGYNAGRHNTGSVNSFFGSDAGNSNTSGSSNAFFGNSAGSATTSGGSNSFFGALSGTSNSTGTENSFFGRSAGFSNSTGSGNSFFGPYAGFNTTTGNFNSMFGLFAGQSNATGDYNSFYGYYAGIANNTGTANSFFGTGAGIANTSGNGNAFLGHDAGKTNTIGANNTALGDAADVFANNLTFATAIGSQAIVSSSNTIVLGRNLDTVQVPGNLNVAGSFTGNFTVPAGNITGVLGASQGGTGIGPSLPPANVYLRSNGSGWSVSGLLASDIAGVVPVTNGGTGSATQNFVDLTNVQTIGGNKTFSGTLTGNVITTATQFNIGGQRMLSAPGAFNTFVGRLAGRDNSGGNNVFVGDSSGVVNTTGSNNAFFGTNAGQQSTTGNNNAFFGESAGLGNTAGSDDNSFFGKSAGRSNAASDNSFFGNLAGSNNFSGTLNSFFGSESGLANDDGFKNSFFGYQAGRSNTSGSDNSFFGSTSGFSNATGGENSFFGNNSGIFNTNGSSNSFFGQAAGFYNISGGSNSFFGRTAGRFNQTGSFNTFIGSDAGLTNTSGTGVTLIGTNANVGSDGLSNATAIGYNSVVSQSNSLVLGNFGGFFGGVFDTKVGIGTSEPSYRLHVVDSQNFGIRVQTNLSGGTVASFGGNGSLQVDAPGIIAGRFVITEAGNVGINTNNPLNKLDVAGIIAVGSLGAAGSTSLCRNASNQISTCSSSLKYKTNIGQFLQGLSLVKQLSPITFDWKDGGMKDVGFGAEDVAKIDPRFVTYNDKGEVEGVKYDRLSVTFVNTFKEQQTQIEEQQKKIEVLTQALCSLKSDLEVCKQK